MDTHGIINHSITVTNRTGLLSQQRSDSVPPGPKLLKRLARSLLSRVIGHPLVKGAVGLTTFILVGQRCVSKAHQIFSEPDCAVRRSLNR